MNGKDQIQKINEAELLQKTLNELSQMRQSQEKLSQNKNSLEHTSEDFEYANKLLLDKINTFQNNSRYFQNSNRDTLKTMDVNLKMKANFSEEIKQCELKLDNFKSKCNQIDQETVKLSENLKSEVDKQNNLSEGINCQQQMSLNLVGQKNELSMQIECLRGKYQAQSDFLAKLTEKEKHLKEEHEKETHEIKLTELKHMLMTKEHLKLKEEIGQFSNELSAKTKDVQKLEVERMQFYNLSNDFQNLNNEYENKLNSQEILKKCLVARIKEDNSKIDTLNQFVEKSLKEIRLAR